LGLGGFFSWYMHHYSEELHDYAYSAFIGAVVGLFLTGLAIELGAEAVHKHKMKKRDSKHENT